MKTKKYPRTPETAAEDAMRLKEQRKTYIGHLLTNLERLQQSYEAGDTW